MPKIAGIESSANMMSVVPIATNTMNIGSYSLLRLSIVTRKLVVVVFVGDVDALAEEADEAVLRVFVVVTAEGLLPRGPQEEDAEDEEDLDEALDDRGAGEDEDAAEDQRQDDAHR